MKTETLTGAMFANMIRNGASELFRNRQAVNDLNVFPIPDGDTGDNMYMTINGGAEAVSGETDGSLTLVATKVSDGMFMGARGNSGVILSRIFAGLSVALKDVHEADVSTFSKAMEEGVRQAYASVAKPVEGTILTVLKDGVNKANETKEILTFEAYFDILINEFRISLENTPNLLPVLKQAGVVDSGAAGLLLIFQGMNSVLTGTSIQEKNEDSESAQNINFDSFNQDSELIFGYCTEFMLQLQTAKVGDVNTFDEKEIFDYINAAGDSVVAFRNGSIIKVHVHTKHPGEVLTKCQNWGEFLKVKIENMTLQHNETLTPKQDVFQKKKTHKFIALVTVAAGDGLRKVFEDLGTDAVVNGGQSMNPSVGDFIKAFDTVDADNIIVFPNNGNVILTAKQAASVYTKSNVTVIANHTVGEAYAAISSFDTSSTDLEETIQSFNQAVESTVTGMVSKANRNTNKNGVQITDGDYIGFDSKDYIYLDSNDRLSCTFELAEKLEAGNYDVLLVLRGNDVPEEEASELVSMLEEKYIMTEVIPVNGMQPVYDYILVLE